MQQIIRDNKFSRSIEIGFAYGTSTLAITEEIVKNNGNHLVIDKYEMKSWGGNGLDLISQAGYSNNLEFIEEYCYIILPKLLEQGEKYDFAYIDSTKQFDWILVNFFYLDKILIKDGIIVFDDISFPSLRKLMRYISQYPNYEIYATYPDNKQESFLRKLFSYAKYLPKSEKYLKHNIINSDFETGINTHCIALKKIGNDKRNWDWHKDF